jgi:hypothetical protein
LWIPIPGIATHLDRKALAPAVDWIELLRAEEAATGYLKQCE